PHGLVSRLDADDSKVRAFVRAHRHLYVPLHELEDTERALADKIAEAKLRANPLYVDLDDPKPRDTKKLDELRAKRRDAEAELDPPTLVSADGHTQVMVIETAFRATDTIADRRLQRELDAIAAGVYAHHPFVRIAYSGGVPQTLAEHDDLVHGMLVS